VIASFGQRASRSPNAQSERSAPARRDRVGFPFEVAVRMLDERAGPSDRVEIHLRRARDAR
jgi:hypothetical protein